MNPELARAQRILVIGGSGAGKSTLAPLLARKLCLPVVHLDAEYWQPGWREPEQAAWDERVARLIAADRWVIDGNYGRTLQLRLTRADAVVWLDYSTARCFGRALRRITSSFGRVRADMAPGCPEKFDLEFLIWVLRFRATQRATILAALEGYPGALVVARTPNAALAILDNLRPQC